MTRTYKANSHLAFTLTFMGRDINIHFIPRSNGGSYFTTTDKELIAMLESSPLYGKYYTKDEELCEDDVYAKDVSNMEELIDEAVNESASVSEDAKEFVDVEEITNLPDAQKYLQDKGVAIRYIRSKTQVLRKAESLGIRFPNLS
jgi:hypothetical protein